VLWFTDLLLGGLYRLPPEGKIETFLKDYNHIGGVVINDDGATVCGGTSSLNWLDPKTGKSGVLLSSVDGRPVPGVNDMYPDGKGGLYFGTRSHAGENGQPSLTTLYRLAADGDVMLVRDGLKFSNGIGLSPDARRLYHNESLLGTFAYDVLADGSIHNRSVFSCKEDCDGLAVDGEGGVWIASTPRASSFAIERTGPSIVMFRCRTRQ
jgi:sugar lactone lactonase YvrE